MDLPVQPKVTTCTPTPYTKVQTVCDIFNERLKSIVDGTNTDYNPLELGNPSECLLGCGIPDLPIQMSVQRLIDKKLQGNHPFRLVSVFDMPDYLAAPIAVFQSKTRQDCKVIFTKMQDKDVNIVVVIELNKIKGKIEVNDVRSVYPKDNVTDVYRWINAGLIEYCDKKEALNWISKQQSNSAEVTNLIEDSTKILKAA